jgi:L-threonylcarbamoyladenylate synthase
LRPVIAVMKAEILPTHTAALFKAAVARAVDCLRDGEVVALPTETVYGLAANAWNASAVERIYKAKGRPASTPLIVHVAGLDLARSCAQGWSPMAAKLAAAFWPGPLTMVLPRGPEIPDIVTAGGETVALRWPSHPFMQAVIRAAGFPLAAPSANLSNQLSPTNAEHVRKSLGDRIPLIIDGGQSQIGIESTVVDLVSSPPRLLRPGMIGADALRAVVGVLEVGGGAGKTLRSPGMLEKHYSPRAKLVILHWRDENELAAHVAKFKLPWEKIHVVAHGIIPLRERFGRVSVIPHDAEAYARALYAELHHCDEAGADLIIVEAPPEGEGWRGISDRLTRAS